MKIYRFKMTLADNEELLRVIDIPGNYTFEAFHFAILSAINFDDSQLASFYLGDSQWNKGQEVTLMDMGDESAPITMRDARIDQMLSKKGDKLIYVYDFILMWTFYLELQDILEHNPNWDYPMLVEEKGEAPDQYGEQGRYPDELSDEDKKIIEQIKKQGFNFGLGNDYEGGGDYGDEYSDDDDYY